MQGFQIIHQLTLPEDQDAEAFVAFMQDEYFPAVHKGPTRWGQVMGLALLRGVSATHERTRSFLLLVNFDGLATGDIRIDDAEVQGKFEGFGVRIDRLGAYDEVAAWQAESGA
jgi:hypothetical protein